MLLLMFLRCEIFVPDDYLILELLDFLLANLVLDDDLFVSTFIW